MIIDCSVVMELISQKVIQDLDFLVYQLDIKYTLPLADDGHTIM